MGYHRLAQPAYRELIDILVIQGEVAPEILVCAESGRARSVLDWLQYGGQPAIPKIESLTLQGAVNREEIRRLIQRAPGVLLEAVLVYAWGKEHLLTWVVTREGGIKGPVVQRCPLDLTLLEVYEYRTQLEQMQPVAEFGRRFYDLLIAPVEEELSGKDTLIIVPSGPLWYIPFSALRTPDGAFLIQRYAIAHAPSLASLPALLSTSGGEAPGQAVAFVNPARSDLSPVPEELGEAVREFVDAVGGGQVLAGTQATELSLKNLLPPASSRGTGPSFRYLVFGCHSLFRPLNPLYSYLALGKAGEEDGDFYAREVLERRLPGVELVVLLACESFLVAVESRIQAGKLGLGRDLTPEEKVRVMEELVRGDELVGLSRAFLLAGAEAVLATQWELSVEMGKQLASGLGEALKAAPTKAAALREAQLRIISYGYEAPWLWAPFILIGNWR